jgi:Na+/proline symporter
MPIRAWDILCGMEPGEKFIRRVLTFVLMIFAFVISIVFGEYYRGLGWLGVLIFIIGASMGALGIYLFKTLRD